MKIIKFIIRIYGVLLRIGTYIDFKAIADDFKGKSVENNKRIRRPGNRGSDKKK
jgi:hypothetical protein